MQRKMQPEIKNWIKKKYYLEGFYWSFGNWVIAVKDVVTLKEIRFLSADLSCKIKLK